MVRVRIRVRFGVRFRVRVRLGHSRVLARCASGLDPSHLFQHDARQRCPALIVLKEEHNNVSRTSETR